MTKRKSFHIVIDYQFRTKEINNATLEEERLLSMKYGIQSCEYENWINATVAMTFSARVNDIEAKIQATKHLIKMLIRKHEQKSNLKILEMSIDAELQDEFYSEYILPFLNE